MTLTMCHRVFLPLYNGKRTAKLLKLGKKFNYILSSIIYGSKLY